MTQSDDCNRAVDGAPSPWTSILAQLRSEPSRTWSIVITVFGDAVVPRGGSLWIGTLLLLFEAMEIGGGVVRTAMSRLTADDWLERRRVGRNTFYTMTAKGRASFATAARRIYGAPPAEWDGRLQVVLAGSGLDAMERAGFGLLADGVWVAPGPVALPAEAAGGIRIQGCADLEMGRRVAEQAWKLERPAAGYRRFIAAFAPLHRWLNAGGALSGLEALAVRTLLIHEYRRVVLRDPLLPEPLLPDDWPGIEARRLCAACYRALLAASEQWLDENGRDEAGALPAASIDLTARFASGHPERVTEFS